MNYAQYLRERITGLRLERNISEYHLSTELGRCKTYIQAISSGKSLPSFEAFFDLCDFFDLTPAEFFAYPAPSEQEKRIRHKAGQLSGKDQLLLEQMIDRMLENGGKGQRHE